MPSQPLPCTSAIFSCMGTEDEELDERSVPSLRPVWVVVGLGQGGGTLAVPQQIGLTLA